MMAKIVRDLRKLIQEKGFENLLIPEDGETIII